MSTKKSAASASQAPDAIEMLTADHKKVKKLFSQFSKLGKDVDAEDKDSLVTQICNELTIHAEIEEKIFYVAVRQAIDDEDLMDEALVEHASAKSLIAQLRGMSPEDDLYDAKVTVLGEQINHHVEEEEGSMFRKAKRAKVDTRELGGQMQQRKLALKRKMGATEPSSRVHHASARLASKDLAVRR